MLKNSDGSSASDQNQRGQPLAGAAPQQKGSSIQELLTKSAIRNSPFLSVFVILLPELLITENLVRFANLHGKEQKSQPPIFPLDKGKSGKGAFRSTYRLEFSRCSRVVKVFIWMQFYRQLPVGLLDLQLRRRWRHLKSIIILRLFNHDRSYWT